MSRMGELAMDIEDARKLLNRGRPARYYTNRILELMDEGVFDARGLVQDLILWMSEDDVCRMVSAYDWEEVIEGTYDKEEVIEGTYDEEEDEE